MKYNYSYLICFSSYLLSDKFVIVCKSELVDFFFRKGIAIYGNRNTSNLNGASKFKYS